MRTRRRAVVALVIGCGILTALGGCMLFEPMEAVIEVSATTGVVPLTITFDGRNSNGSSEITAHRWLLGTGEEWYEPSGTYTYENAGRYTLTLTVRTADGGTDTASIEIVVDPALWVCDEDLDRIYKLDIDGAVRKTIDLPVSDPKGIAIGEAAGKAWVFVACFGGGNQRILRVDQQTG